MMKPKHILATLPSWLNWILWLWSILCTSSEDFIDLLMATSKKKKLIRLFKQKRRSLPAAWFNHPVRASFTYLCMEIVVFKSIRVVFDFLASSFEISKHISYSTLFPI